MREDWIEVELGKVCDIISGKNQKKVKNPNGKYPIYGSGGIFGYSNEYLCEAGTTIIGRKGTINSPIYVKQRFWNVDTAFGISPSKLINSKIVYFFCRSFNFYNLDKSTTIPSLAKRDLLSILIPLAPLPEQRAIVAKIEKLFSDIDSGVANLKAAKAKLEIYRQAVLKKAFEGGLTKEWREKNPGFDSAQPAEQTQPLNAYTERSRNEVQMRSLSGVETTDLPKGWEKKKLGDVCELNPKHENKNSLKGDFEVQFVPMALVDEVINNINLLEIRKLSEVQKKSYTYFADNDVIFAKVTPCMENGKIAVAKNMKNGIGYGSSEFHVFRCGQLLHNIYLFYFLVQSIFRQDAQRAMTGAVGLRRVPKKYLEDYILPLPPKEEQHQIVTEIETRLSVCDNILATIDDSLEKSKALRQSILKKAFEGKLLDKAELKACRKEADWQPADKLLAKIKKEKDGSLQRHSGNYQNGRKG